MKLKINHHNHSAVKPGRPGSELFPHSPLGEQVEGIPTGRDVAWEPLVDYRRNGVSETTIHGAVAWAHGDEVIHSFGGNVLCYGRSMMKPFMLKAFVNELANLSWEQKAITVASHNGDTEHVAAAQSLLSKSERPLMLTPLDVPLIQFGRQVRRPRRWYHTCLESMLRFFVDAGRKDGIVQDTPCQVTKCLKHTWLKSVVTLAMTGHHYVSQKMDVVCQPFPIPFQNLLKFMLA